MSPPLRTSWDWFVFGLNCQKTYDYLNQSFGEFNAGSVNYIIQQHFLKRIDSLIVLEIQTLMNEDKYYDNYDDLAKKSLSELQTIHAWCQVLEEKRKQGEDLSCTVVYDFAMSDSIVPYDI